MSYLRCTSLRGSSCASVHTTSSSSSPNSCLNISRSSRNLFDFSLPLPVLRISVFTVARYGCASGRSTQRERRGPCAAYVHARRCVFSLVCSSLTSLVPAKRLLFSPSPSLSLHSRARRTPPPPPSPHACELVLRRHGCTLTQTSDRAHVSAAVLFCCCCFRGGDIKRATNR